MTTRKHLALLLCITLLSFSPTVMAQEDTAAPTAKWSDSVATSFDGGDGSKGNPYQIATPEQLSKLAYDVNLGAYGSTHDGEYFILTKDINLAGKIWTPIGTGTAYDSNNSFDAFFDGKNHTISNMHVDESTSASCAGLFGNMASSADDPLVQNLKIINATVIASGQNAFAGILAGYTTVFYPQHSAYFKNCHVSGTVTGTHHTGGFIGNANYINAENCSSDAIVTGGNGSGGFIGYLFYPRLTNCTAKGSVSGSWSVGGFAGDVVNVLSFDDAGLTSCVSYTNVTAHDWNAGGFAGYAAGTSFEKCAAYGTVTSTVTTWEPKLGGFAGTLTTSSGYRENDSSVTYYSSIENCYFTGTLSPAHPEILPSGLVANACNATVENCAYNAEANPGLAAVSTVDGELGTYTTQELTAYQTKKAVCQNVFDGHSMNPDNACTRCDYKLYSICVNGIEVTSDNASDVLGDTDSGATVSYNEGTNTLTLNNARLGGTDIHPIYAQTDLLKIKFSGTNILCDDIWGIINAKGDIEIEGDADAALNITAETMGIQAQREDSNYNLIGGDIKLSGGRYTINTLGSELQIGDESSLYSIALYAGGNLDITGNSNVNIINEPVCAMLSETGDIKIDAGSTVNIGLTQSNGFGAIECCSGDIVINGVLSATSAATAAIYAYGSVTASEDASVILSSGSWKALIANKLIVNGAAAEISSTTHTAVSVQNGIEITGATSNVTFTSGSDTGAITFDGDCAMLVEDRLTALASTDITGIEPTAYVTGNNATYKWVNVFFNVTTDFVSYDTESKKVTVSCPVPGEYTVILANYRTDGRQMGTEIITEQFTRGIHSIKTSLALDTGDKVMLWKKGGISPLCDAFIIE